MSTSTIWNSYRRGLFNSICKKQQLCNLLIEMQLSNLNDPNGFTEQFINWAASHLANGKELLLAAEKGRERGDWQRGD